MFIVITTHVNKLAHYVLFQVECDFFSNNISTGAWKSISDVGDRCFAEGRNDGKRGCLVYCTSTWGGVWWMYVMTPDWHYINYTSWECMTQYGLYLFYLLFTYGVYFAAPVPLVIWMYNVISSCKLLNLACYKTMSLLNVVFSFDKK